jgi:hypothetical protein
MIHPVTRDEAFDQLILTALEALRNGERRLQQLFGSLLDHPPLRELFLREMAELQDRADRLEEMLNRADAFRTALGNSGELYAA